MSELVLTRRTLLGATVIMGGAAFLAGCAPKTAAVIAPSNKALTGTLQFYTSHTADDQVLFQSSVDAFTKKNPGVSINYLNIAAQGDYETKLKTLSVGGDLPDVFYVRTGQIGTQASAGWLKDLSPYVKSNAEDVAAGDIWPALKAQMSYKGKLHALPYDISNVGVYYNKKIFDDEGIPYPKDDWTWDEFWETAEAFKRVEGGRSTRWGVNSNLWEWFQQGVFASYGGGLISKDGTKCTAARTENVDALTKFIGAIANGSALTFAATPQGVDSFANGLTAMQLNGSWATQAQRANVAKKFEWDVAKLPVGPSGKRAVATQGGSWGISASSKNTEVAEAFAAFIASTGQMDEFIAKPVRGIPGRQSSTETWQKTVLAQKLPPENVEAFVDQMQNDSIDFAYPDYWGDLVTIWAQRVKSLSKPGDVSAALKLVEQEVNAAAAL